MPRKAGRSSSPRQTLAREIGTNKAKLVCLKDKGTIVEIVWVYDSGESAFMENHKRPYDYFGELGLGTSGLLFFGTAAPNLHAVFTTSTGLAANCWPKRQCSPGNAGR